MYSIFAYTSKFNQNLSWWNVSKVTSYAGYNSNTPLWILPKPPFGI